MQPLPSSGKIRLLQLKNFRSYEGLQTFGPFCDFTAIICPNGAGRLNLMGAIRFVLGVPSGLLQGGQLEDLIYANGDRGKDQKGREAFVKLDYQVDNGDKIEFRIMIMGSGGCQYRLNGVAVSLSEYNAKLKSIGILVEGDVESIASKNPKELTALLEQISGSDEFKKSYEDLEEQKARAKKKLQYVYPEKRTKVMRRKQNKAQKEEAEKHLRLQEKLDSLEEELFLWQLSHIEKDTENLLSELEDEKRFDDVRKEQEKCDSEETAKKKEQAGYLKQMTRTEGHIAKKKIELYMKAYEKIEQTYQWLMMHEELSKLI